MKPSKYGSKRVKLMDGSVFDSKHEYQRWNELLVLEKAGKINGLMRQVKFELIPAQVETYERRSEKTGRVLQDGRRCIEQAVNYVADFVYWQDEKMVVEDAKGVRTPDYIIKRKLMLYIHGIRIREV